jgi:Arc/MetJ-type ribon-helix-helix transcriptional regulator
VDFCAQYSEIMKVELTPQQEAWLKQAIAEGRFASVEDAMRTGVELLRDASIDPEGWSTEDVRAEIARRRNGAAAEPWEGANAFTARMREKHAAGTYDPDRKTT